MTCLHAERLSSRVGTSCYTCRKHWSGALGVLTLCESPHDKKDAIKPERVQKRFSKILPGFEGLSHKERLNHRACPLLYKML